MNIQLVTDSTAYIPESLVRDHQIHVVSLGVHYNHHHQNEMDMYYSEFYQYLENADQLPTSSQPPVEKFVTLFSNAAKMNEPVVGIFISSDMSGTFSTATMAKEMVLEEFPDAEIHLIDSRTNCMEMGFAVLEAATLRETKRTAFEIASSLKNFVQRSRFVFAPKTLEYLKKGGRIGGASALIGSVLKILPILTVENGQTSILTKVRTQRKAIQTMLDGMMTDFEKYGCGQVAVHHIHAEDAGNALAIELEKRIKRKVPVIPIGPVIGLHVGPGTVGIAYTMQKNRP